MAAMMPRGIEMKIRLAHFLVGLIVLLVLLGGHAPLLAKLLDRAIVALVFAILHVHLVVGLRGMLAQLLGRHVVAVVLRHGLASAFVHALSLLRAVVTDAFLGLGNGHIRKYDCCNRQGRSHGCLSDNTGHSA